MHLTNHPNEWVQYTFQLQFVVQNRKDQNGTGTFVVHDQSQEISSPKLMNSRRRDVIRGIQPKFVYQSTYLNYYELVENW
jgi:hypothetical protein